MDENDIRWQPLDEDPEYQCLNEMKAARMENLAYSDDEDDIDSGQVRHEAEMDRRNEFIEQMHELGYTQREISEA